MAKTIVGLFDDREDARTAIEELGRAGFMSDRVSVIATEQARTMQSESQVDQGNTAAEGAVTGLASGAVVGGLLGVLVGMGAIFIPGGVIVAGPIAGLLTGVAAGAATGGILGGLIGMGIPKEHADIYAEAVRRGGVLVAVTPEGREREVEDILRANGAVDIDERAEAYRQEGFVAYDPKAPAYTEEQREMERERYRKRTQASQQTNAQNATGTVNSVPETSGLGVNSTSMTDSYTGLPPHTGVISPSAGMVEPAPPPRPVNQPDPSLSTGTPNAQRDASTPPPPPVEHVRPAANVDPAMASTPPPMRTPETGTPRREETGRLPSHEEAMSGGQTSQPVGGTTRTEGTGRPPSHMDPALNMDLRDNDRPSDSSMEDQHREGSIDESLRPDEFQEEYDRRFSHMGISYQQSYPAFEHGFRSGRDERYQGRDWNDVEMNLRDDWEARQPGTWILYREIIRSGWDRCRTRSGRGGAELI